MERKYSTLLLLLFVLVCSPLAFSSDNIIVVSKEARMLYVISYPQDTIFKTGICCGRNFGNKTQRGDCKTPEGMFTIGSVENSTDWIYNTDDGRKVKGVYGPYFFRLSMPGRARISVGIHGTSAPWSIGRRTSHGCIRLTNEDIVKLKDLVKVGTRCVILPDRKR